MEVPGVGVQRAVRKLGGYKAVVDIVKRKYLFSLDETPESFVQAMRIVMDDEGEGGGE
jgi:hypothetical protein